MGEHSGKGELRKPCGGLQPQGLYERQAPPAQARLRMQGKAIACAAHAPAPRVIPPAVPAGAAVAEAGGDAPAAAVCAAGHDAGECPLPVRTHLVDYLPGPLPQTRVCQHLLGSSRPELHPAALVEDLARYLPFAFGIPHGQGQTQTPPHLSTPLPAKALLPRQHQRVPLQLLLLWPVPLGKFDQLRSPELTQHREQNLLARCPVYLISAGVSDATVFSAASVEGREPCAGTVGCVMTCPRSPAS